MGTHARWTFALLLASSVAGYGQQTNEPQNGTGWRRFGDSAAGAAAPADSLPPSSPLTLPAGTWITVRVDQPLSSDRNQQGDTFTATLAQPVIANGRVIARRGQTVSGVVIEAQKGGRVSGTSRLGLELTEIGLADGRQIQVHTRMMERHGDTSVGRDVAAVGTTTAVGAAVGAAADGGFGAGMGAIAGAAASTIGVLVTRGRATEVYPESPLTFRLEAPITLEAGVYQEAFQPVTQQDYEQTTLRRQGPPPRPAPYYGSYPPAYYDGYPPYYYGGYPPYYYGPSFFIYSGPRFYGHRGYRR